MSKTQMYLGKEHCTMVRDGYTIRMHLTFFEHIENRLNKIGIDTIGQEGAEKVFNVYILAKHLEGHNIHELSKVKKTINKSAVIVAIEMSKGENVLTITPSESN